MKNLTDERLEQIANDEGTSLIFSEQCSIAKELLDARQRIAQLERMRAAAEWVEKAEQINNTRYRIADKKTVNELADQFKVASTKSLQSSYSEKDNYKLGYLDGRADTFEYCAIQLLRSCKDN